MQALRLVYALIRIPRLFASLLLVPLFFGLILVFGQIIVSGVFLSASRSDASFIKRRADSWQDDNIVRRILYGSGTPLKTFEVCRWQEHTRADGRVIESPPSGEACRADRLDAALQVSDPQTFDATTYARIFKGNVERLHICKRCRPDLTIKIQGDTLRTDLYSVQALMLLNLVRFNQDLAQLYVRAASDLDRTNTLLGDKFLHSAGLRDAVSIDGFKNSSIIGLNIAALVLVALFLALKAHRKVLDYFAKNGALLPMVAATGQRSFYAALWMLTALRVGAFLIAAVPGVVYATSQFASSNDDSMQLSSDGFGALALWIIAMAAGMALATLIASIGELKQRHTLLSFGYKYIPLALCLAGMLVWAASFFIDGSSAGVFRSIVTAAPILGMGPVLIGPVVKPSFGVLAIHALLSAAAMWIILRHNARWFAAHLEEL